MQQTSWLLRPVMPLMLLPYLLLITTPSTGNSYGFREGRYKRSPYGMSDQSQLSDETKTTTAATSANNKNNNHNNNNHNKNMPPYRNPGEIIFPDDEFICPERRQGMSYCTEVPNYLEITKLDRVEPEKFVEFRSYFRDDLIEPQNVTQRMNSPEVLDEYYCASSSRLIYPKTAENKESKWLYVVQTAKHKQGILVEQCEGEDKPCRFSETLPRFYKSRCKQHTVLRTMIVLVNDEMKEEQVKMPNCCKCVLRNTGGQS